MFMTVDQAAQALGYSPQTIRNRIADGSLRAIQGATGGAYRIPTMEVEAFQRRNGLATALRIKIPRGVKKINGDELYATEIEPVVRELGVDDPEEVLRMMRADPKLMNRYPGFLTAYTMVVESQSLALSAG